MMGVFSEFERAMIQERVKAGLARAKDDGVTLGRPTLETKDPERPAKAKAMRANGGRGSQDCQDAGHGCRHGAPAIGVSCLTLPIPVNGSRTSPAGRREAAGGGRMREKMDRVNGGRPTRHTVATAELKLTER